MAKSIGGLVFDITASTEKFQAQMRRVEQTNERIANQEVANARETAHEEERLQKIRDQIAAKRERSDELEAEAARASAGRAKKIRDQLRKIGESIAALETKEKNLAAEQKRNDTQRLGRMTKLRNELAKQTAEYNKMSGVVGRVKNAFAGVGAALIAGLSVGAVVNKFNDFINTLDGLAKRARDVGITASQLQELSHQANLAGIATGTLDTSIKSFNRNVSLAAMGTGEAQKALDSMGISIKDANGATKSQSALLKEVATYFAENAGAAENAGRATRLFGESGAEMLRIFESGEDVVNKVFNAHGIDAAAAAAERYKNNIEDLSNNIMPTVYRWVGGIADIINKKLNPDGWYRGVAEQAYEVLNLTRAQKKELIDVETQLRKLQDQLESTPSMLLRGSYAGTTYKQNPEYVALREQIDALKERRKTLSEAAAQQIIDNKNVERARAKNAEFEKNLTDAETERLRREQVEYERLIELTFMVADAQDKAAAAQKKRQDEAAAAAKKAADAQKILDTNRREFELQTQISVLRAQGRTAEAEQLEFAKQRNELMRKYGYSIAEATRAQQTLNELNKPAGGTVDGKNLDDMQKKAQSILERGEGGTIGKKTLADAQAAAEGRIPEGGFKTAMFKDYNPAKSKFKKINVDAKTAKQNLDNDAKDIERQNGEKLGNIEMSLSNMNNTITDIKNSVDAVATNQK